MERADSRQSSAQAPSNLSNGGSVNPTIAINFVQEFHKVTTQYCQALHSVIPIFTYMVSLSFMRNTRAKIPVPYKRRFCNQISSNFTFQNRFYVESKLQTNLKAELLRLYSERIADAFVEHVLRKY